jgi:putative glutamine amidotransferase
MLAEIKRRPRVGVPWRTVVEEKAGQRARYEDYLCAIRDAGGEPIEISLLLPDNELQGLAESCDAFVLPGSPADVNPIRYGSVRHNLTADADLPRERADDRLLGHALPAGKPLLAICFGIQSLNVHLAGSLLQDIRSELQSSIDHDREEDHADTHHAARMEGGRLAELAGQAEIRVNSSHHQAILIPGRGLCITARAPDGVIEAVEWTGGPGWVVGVQWHPERMRGDALSEALFRRLVSEGRAISAR